MMNIKLKAGDIVRIENAYFKNDNGLHFVAYCPGDASWNGNDYCLYKICKNGKISKVKYSITFWPLCSTVSSKTKAEEADAWNEKHATIAKVDGINTEFVIEYFRKEIVKHEEQYKFYSVRWGEESETAISFKRSLEHYKNVVARMTCTNEDIAQEEQKKTKEVTEVTKELKEETQKNIAEVKEEIELNAEESQEVERTYYPINEDTARIAKEINSFSEYKTDSATEKYRQYCDKAYDILDKIKIEKPEQTEHFEKKVDYYCRKLAEYYNDYYRNEASCPSIMICGAGNFPVKKKEHQNTRRETLHKTWEYLENYLQKIENILYNEQPIKLGDSDTIEKLTAKIQQLEKEHKMHMVCNAYCKKNGTLKGFSGLEELGEKEATYIENSLKKSPTFIPFIIYHETANIRYYKKQLEKLLKEKEAGTAEQIEVDSESNKLFTVLEDKEIMRLQIIFDGIPPVNARDILKSNGFKWSPKNKAWQRQLTDDARYAYKNIKNELKSAMVA